MGLKTCDSPETLWHNSLDEMITIFDEFVLNYCLTGGKFV